LTSRTKSDLERLQSLARSAQIECEFEAADLARAPTQAFEACVRRFGRVDLVIHSAGVGRFGDFEDLRFVSATNIEASFLLMQAVYKQMKNQVSAEGRPSAIQNPQIQWITSVAAEKPFEQSSIYCMSKYAQRGLIDVMRLYAYQDGIRILEVKPGAALTPMWGEVTPEMESKMMQAQDVAQSMIDAFFVPSRASVEVLTIRPLQGDL
jgi:sepiapterin reductase